MFTKSGQNRKHMSDDAFMSYNFWLTNAEVEQIEALANQHHIQPAAVVQRIIKHALKQLREKGGK
ncbi:hypothetical protein ACFO25_13140 [Paenactinomyces guangxiensis]|uniref:Uncharacterized protein n=1 Tax=Paenactinomyces guangxiensis TaxID=1490290 RepID=A0A7W1WP80_9BACL|nr:hypothetical protein [Paenactinomyces guangxiensis]MBA4493394.1 hypothetical protein [Paenactinomyces guangxiensis]MBH8590484.1 hypothetical protein [Paenactinomyces guangxiensis]